MPKKKRPSGHPGGMRCPDCGRRSVRQQLVHDPTCPAARALDDLMVQDADWFATRPDAEHRCRWITAAELMELPSHAGRQLSPKSVIHVQQLQPGVRQRAVDVPGSETLPGKTVALFGHPSTYALATRDMGPLPATRTGALPSGLEARTFTLPPGIDADDFSPDVEGLVLLRPGDALPVPFS